MRLKELALILFPITVAAQSNVDKLVRTLDSLSLVSFDSWKVSPDLKMAGSWKGDPAKSGFDDSQWEILRLGQWIYPDSCWIRKEIILPDHILGQPVRGSIKFLVSVDDYGYLWVNGESKGHFPWNGEFELTKNAKAGQKFLIAIKAINTGGPLRLLRAAIESESSKPVQQMIRDFSLNVKVGQKLLSFDTYQTNARVKVDPGIDKSTMEKSEKTRLNMLLQDLATRVRVDALARGSMVDFTASINQVRSQLSPVATFAKRYTLFFDANAHIDAAWLWREKETVEVCKNTFSSVLNLMDARPEFTYTQSAAAYYDWMERLYPDLFKNMKTRIRDGRWEVVGGMWVEPDCNLPSGESWMRHLLYSKRYFLKKLGVDVKIGWNPDSFGYNWNMPQFYRNAGVDVFITQKIGWNETNVFPHRVFWWQAPDGSRILAYFPFDYVYTIDDPYRVVDWLRQFEANTGFTKMLILFGVGDHGGGPSLEMLDRVERLKALDIFPSIEYKTAGKYLEWLRRQDLSNVPIWNDELYLEYHQGTYTTQAKMKEFNRRSEVLLTNAEKFSSLATMFGGKYNGPDLEGAWRNALFNQFHDILPGSGIREVYIDATERYQEVQALGNFELKKSLDRIAHQINTSRVKRGIPVLVFNPLSWERTDVVAVQLLEGDSGPYSVFDMNGKERVSQLVEKGKYASELLFIADKVPSVGYKLYELRRQAETRMETIPSRDINKLENEFFELTIDTDSGWVKGIVDKRTGKEVLKGFGNQLQIFEDKPAEWDAWNIGLTGIQYPSKLRKIVRTEYGPLRSTIRVVRDYLKPGVRKDFPTEDFPSTFFTQDVTLYNSIDRIDFTTQVDWWEEKTMLKLAFPLTMSDSVATYEIPFGTIQRSTRMRDSWEKAKVEVPAQRWADVSRDNYGVSLLNKSKYGYDIKGNTLRLSLLRSPKWPDPTADRGKHSIEYALYPHQGTWREAGTVRRGYEYNNPLIAFVTEAHKGRLPETHSFVQLSPSNLVLTTIKKAEDSDAWVVQWYDAEGKNSQAVLKLPQNPKRVVMSNFLEEDGTPVRFDGNPVTVETKKSAVVTIKVYF